MATAPPILIWTPGGGVPVGPISNPPVYSQAGTTQLVNGQSYVDVVFGSIQTTDEWVLVECVVVNEVDIDLLYIWPGIITDKTQAGFRLQLNGMPDSGNYYLHWAVSGINITPSAATTYTLTGPSSGGFSEASTFTVALPSSTTVPGTVTVTPDDGGVGGTFSPTSVTLTTSIRSATFTYTPLVYGVITIGVDSGGSLLDPASLAFTCVTTFYDFIGPSVGSVGVVSTNFTVSLPVGGVVIGTVTVTPSSGGGGGTFTPATVALTTAAPSATFTYTPASAGSKTISVTNNGGLTNPTDIVYVVTAWSPASITGLKLWLKADSLVLSDGDPVSTWTDSSGLANNATQSGSARPTYKTNIQNGKPVVRFVSASTQIMNLGSSISGASTWTVLAVMKPTTQAVDMFCVGSSTSGAVQGPHHFNNGYYVLVAGGSAYAQTNATQFGGVFRVMVGTSAPTMYANGTNIGANLYTAAAAGDFATVGGTTGGGGPTGGDGDLAEVLLYDSVLGTTDQADVETYLLTKYGLP